MPTYLVERYLPGRDRAWLEAALARLPKDRSGVIYLGSTYVPEEDSCFCRFEASDAQHVRFVNELARVPVSRISVATEIEAPTPEAVDRAGRRAGLTYDRIVEGARPTSGRASPTSSTAAPRRP